jgi:glycine hydroxymethyltransferase
VGAYTVADMAHIAGLIAGGAAQNPFDAGFDVITTTTHKTLRGPRGGMILTRDNEDIAKRINKAVFPGLQGGPHMNLVAAKAIALGEAMTPAFKEYAAQILKNAKAMEQVFHNAGIRMLGGGTSNHLILADVYGSLGVTGQEAEVALDEIGITLNKNMIADETRSALDPSGIRFGTPAMTTRRMKEGEATQIAEFMVERLKNIKDTAKAETLKAEVKNLCLKFPVPDVLV